MEAAPKAYEPKDVEDRIYAMWEQGGYFHEEPDSSRKPFCIAIPPPNVTGSLHLGHALDNTLQDVLVRFKRMQGYCTLWIPGTDHAGIATQNVVEKALAKEGLTRHDLGRERFVERVWEWKQLYGDTIIRQLRRLGSSCDWSRERFTMDEGLSKAVRKVFVDLYDEGLIYRGNRIINWCPRCETALSDIEVNHVETMGELAHFSYRLADGDGDLTVATTRLETMLGDTAIAVHPEDTRYQRFVGRAVVHPFDGRLIPIVADEAVEPEFGTGAVKVTPAHDPTDFEIAQRHGLPMVNIFDGRAHINENGGKYAGLERYEARSRVREDLVALGLFGGAWEHTYSLGHCDRCDTIVEPWLSEQWFVSMQPLAEPAIAAVRHGRTRFHPERWTNFYLNWMEQIRDWCISRQLWWGHRIPVWYCDSCDHVWASLEDPTACVKCSSSEIRQDEDVLDTWFSSQLWPFSTLGWPERTPELEYFYPTSVIVPGYDIIHLWVSRMIMSGLHFMGDVPFRYALIHGIVRDPDGKKMSKSAGNVRDPLDLMDKYGTDALRFTLAEHATGQDIFLHDEWLGGARNFANKLWNAARFVLSDVADDGSIELPPKTRWTLADRWILSRLERVTHEVTEMIEGFEISSAARSLYEFTWSSYCDWYIEAAKPRLYSKDVQSRSEVVAILVHVLTRTIKLLHPIMPFITEEIWSNLPGAQGALIVAEWPQADMQMVSLIDEQRFERVQEVITALRRFRSNHGIPLKTELPVGVHGEGDGFAQLLGVKADLSTLARHCIFDFEPAPETQGPQARLPAGGVELTIPLEGLLDLGAERDRLAKALSEVASDIGRIEGKLGNPSFVDKAPAPVVDEQRRRLDESLELRTKLIAQLEELS